jgi:hypothetical protein
MASGDAEDLEAGHASIWKLIKEAQNIFSDEDAL